MAAPIQPLRIGRKLISENKCKQNFKFWMQGIPKADPHNAELKEILQLSDNILPAHTFAYKYTNPETGLSFNPLKSIFGFNEKTGEFSQDSFGLKAKSLRSNEPIPDLHMKTSVKIGHDIFLFAYHGVHNPYHRLKDDVPVRPFGLFIKKKGVELFPYNHGAPCDVAEENILVDRLNLDKYYLLPEDLRIFKGHQIHRDTEIADFWYYFGNPETWKIEDEYGKNIYRKTGEFRYLEQIKPDSIEAILWPFFTDVVLPDGSIDMDENLDLLLAFSKAFPEITVIQYKHDVGDSYDWPVSLVEASFYSTKYYLKYRRFPKDADFAKNEILSS